MRTRVRIRRLWMLALLLLGSNLLLSLTFYLVLAAHAATVDPTFSTRLHEVQQAYYPDSAESHSEAELQRFSEALQPLFEPVNWYQVALITSVVGFGGLGLVAGRLGVEPRWMSALPLATMLSGPNPAILPTFLENQGLPGKHLELSQQVTVFALQMVLVYATTYLTSKGPKSP